MVKDYSHGIIHEPFFYGQDYNFPLEAWAAVPGYWAGLPPHIILPVISLLFSLTPFFIILHLINNLLTLFGHTIYMTYNYDILFILAFLASRLENPKDDDATTGQCGYNTCIYTLYFYLLNYIYI